MSDDSAPRQKSSFSAMSSHQITRSSSEPSITRTDLMSLYTTRPDGVPPVILLFLHLTVDFFAFFIRGGISTLMFSMDIALRLFLFVLESWLQVPGVFMISYTARFLMWSYQMLMWVIYTAVELVFYLPTPVLIVYLMLLAVVYYKMPEELNPVLRSMLWLSEHFLNMLKRFVMSNVV